MSRPFIFSILFGLLLAVGIAGVWLLKTSDEVVSRPLAGKKKTGQSLESDSRPNMKAPPQPVRREGPSAAFDQVRQVPPTRELVVARKLASEMRLSDDEQELVDTIITEMQEGRSRLFAELAAREKTVEEVSEGMGNLRRQMDSRIREALNDDRASVLQKALRKADGYVPKNDQEESEQ